MTATATLTVVGTASAADPTGSISGTVYASTTSVPIVGAVVFVNDFDTGLAVGNTTTDASGDYTVGGLGTGNYRVHVNATAQDVPIQYYDGSTTAEGADAVAVTDGVDTPNIDFIIPTAGVITGTVKDEFDTAIVGAEVWASRFDSGSGGRGAVSDGSGVYFILGVAQGTYRVQAFAGDQGFASKYYLDAAAFDLATPVFVTSSITTTAIDFTLAAGGAIAGTVYQSDGVTPIAGVHVFANGYDTYDGGRGTTTNATGDYILPGLAPGDYRVQAEPNDPGTVGEFYDDTRDWSEADRVSVTGGVTTSNIDFSLAQGGSISGVVTRESDGTPVAGAEVWANTYICCAGGNGTTTADGSFTIPRLAPGDFRVYVRPQEEGLVGEFYASTTDWSEAERVTVVAGVDTPGTDFTLAGGGAIEGTVYETDGVTPIANVFVHASKYNTGAYANGDTTDADGTYRIPGVSAGVYRVETWVPDDLGFAREFYTSTPDWNLAAQVTVNEGLTTPNIDFTLDAGGSISGVAYEDDGVTPVPNAHVWANQYDCCGGGNGAQTDDTGAYTIPGLAPGNYRVGVHASDSGLIGQFFSSTAAWDQATAVSVSAGVDTPDINFLLSAGGAISGTVYESDGVTPVPDADIWVETYDCCEGGGNGARSDDQGNYTIRGLAPGDYRVGVHAPGQGLAGGFYISTTDWEQAARVTVTTNTTTPDIIFLLATDGSISGTVFSEGTGLPIANVDVWANAYDCCGGGNGARTAADGTYTIDGLSPGSYRVGVHIQEQGFAGEFYASTTDWNDATPVVVASGADTAKIDFSLPQGGSISGTVTDEATGQPVANAHVWANQYDCCGGGNGTDTDASGNYTIDGLAPGDYRVGVHSPGGGLVGEFYASTTNWNDAVRVSVAAATTTAGIDFSLDGGGAIAGRVTRSARDSCASSTPAPPTGTPRRPSV